MKENDLINVANRIRVLAQNGLVYATNEYDTERYQELLSLSNQLTALLTDNTLADINACFRLEEDYVTPKVDIRAVVFNEEGKLLLVKEKMDGRWSLPGGWADIGFSPTEVAVKEVKEETGLDVTPLRLLAVHDKKCHHHPPALHYAYKLFIQCEITGGCFNTVFDILDRGFFGQDEIPPLSEERVLKEQIDLMFAYKNKPDMQAGVD